MAVLDATLMADEPFVQGGVAKSLAASGGVVAVGAPFRSTWFGQESGAVYLYRRDGAEWVPVVELLGWELGRFHQFGRAIALSSDMLVVGAPNHHDRGALFVYFLEDGEWRARWRQEAPPSASFFGSVLAASGAVVLAGSILGGRLVSAYRREGTQLVPDGALSESLSFSDDFGVSFAFSADTGLAVVGAPRLDNRGAAFVFERFQSGDGPSSWFRRARLQSPAAQAGGRFGESVAISGVTMLVGEPGGGPVSGMGLAHLFELSPTGEWGHRQTLRASDPAIEDMFGSTVALSSDLALISAAGDNTAAGVDAGSVYAFRRTGQMWNELGKLAKETSVGGERFGSQLVLDGDSAVVASQQDVQFGAATVFRHSVAGWRQEVSLKPREPSQSDAFGHAVTVDGDVAVVGAPTDDPGAVAADSGAVYVFKRSTGESQQLMRLTAPRPVTAESFGFAVQATNDLLVVGAPPDLNAGPMTPGSAYVLRRLGDSWAHEAVLVPQDGTPRQLFGSAVAVSGDTIAVGSRLANSALGERTGAAYVFVREGSRWVQQAKLVGSDAQPVEGSCSAVAIDGDTIVVGARAHDTSAGRDAGAAYVFTRSGVTWTQQAMLVPDPLAANDRFGFAVAILGDVIAVGAPGRDFLPTGPGYACVFRRQGSTWSQHAILRPETATGARVGSAVALGPGRVVVGASGRRRVHVYAASGPQWLLVDQLAGQETDGGLGAAIDLSANTLIAGAAFATTPLGRSGTAHIYTLHPA